MFEYWIGLFSGVPSGRCLLDGGDSAMSRDGTELNVARVTYTAKKQHPTDFPDRIIADITS